MLVLVPHYDDCSKTFFKDLKTSTPNNTRCRQSTTRFDFVDEVNRYCFFLENQLFQKIICHEPGEPRHSKERKKGKRKKKERRKKEEFWRRKKITGQLEASFLIFLTLGSIKQINSHTVQGSVTGTAPG